MEIPQSFAWAIELVKNEHIKDYTTVFLLTLLADLADEKSEVMATNNELAEMMCVPVITIRRSLAELKDAGLITTLVANGHERTISVKWTKPDVSSPLLNMSNPMSDMSSPLLNMSNPMSETNDLKSVAGDLQSTAEELKKYVGELKGCLASVKRQARQGGSQAGAITVPADDHYSGSMPSSKDYEEILTYLNKKAGKRFRVDSENTKYIDGRWKKGFRVPDFKRVIDNKCTEWLHTGKRFSDGTPAEFYLRPKTLFSEKNFENYLNQTPVDEYGNPITSAAFGQSKLDREIIERKRQREQERQQHRS